MPLPLEGIRVLDNGLSQAGTFPTRLMADFGAEVIRVENYLSPDVSHHIVYPNGAPGDPYWESGGVYHEQHRNKTYCVGLDARKPGGREAFIRLAQVSDVVLDSHPPGVMDRLGLSYEALRTARPDIIYVSTSGYGEGGPFSSLRSYGMLTEIMCGIGSLNGYEGEGVRRGVCPLTDHPSSYHGAFVIMAALINRKRTGRGAWIDISQYEIGINVIGDAHLANAIGAPVPDRSDHRDPGAAFSGVFKCVGYERWVAISAATLEGWEALCHAIGRHDLAILEPSEFASAIVAKWCEERSAEDVASVLTGIGVAAAPVNDARDLLLDEHLNDRDFFALVDQAPSQQSGRRAWPGRNAVFSATPAEVRARAPMLGEHNRLVATTLLGYTEEEYEALEKDGAFGDVPLAAGMKPPPADQAARTQLPAAAFGRTKLHDPAFMQRLKDRFGADYGERVPG